MSMAAATAACPCQQQQQEQVSDQMSVSAAIQEGAFIKDIHVM
jgi:hypothetical protein